ncbi:hypothetical protein SETIT_1G161600v2 [Setaria italica]|uniref:Uncharacterized protein n=1 Tax=Setaria italica TaxID=4555 RepID=A0A368PL97_SETIT|nr:hypothetical protein SETIT_1G161600v2 [Setaria italica]
MWTSPSRLIHIIILALNILIHTLKSSSEFIPNPSPTWLLAVQKGAAARPLVDVREWRGEAEVVQRKGAAAVGDGNGTATAAATGDRKGVAAAAGVKRTCKAAASWMCLPLLDRSLIPPSTGAVLKGQRFTNSRMLTGLYFAMLELKRGKKSWPCNFFSC